MVEVKCAGMPKGYGKLALTNRVYVSESDFDKLMTMHSTQGENPVTPESGLVCMANDAVPYTVTPHHAVDSGTVAMNMLQRIGLTLAINDPVRLSYLAFPKRNFVLGSATMELDLLAPSSSVKTFDAAEVEAMLRRLFKGQVFANGQTFAVIIERTQVKVTVRDAAYLQLDLSRGRSESKASEGAGGAGGPAGEAPVPFSVGQLLGATSISVTKASGAKIKITGATSAGSGGSRLFEKGFNFEALGVGGLDEEFKVIFRRAFASRVYPPDIMKHMGINHVRGMLLYGPPGCGKTLIARCIGKALNAREPKIVNGPEILNKYVGASEENIRKLFEDAEKEQEEAGDESELHIIIFDEIDAICKSRGTSSDGTGVHDSIVNQLLSKIDGVESLNNVLLIGMTNRKDMIDEAILRPGRLEVHVEIGLPSEEGRVQILGIHTRSMSASGMLADDVDMEVLAERSSNFTGAEIEALVKAAASHAMSKRIDPSKLGTGAEIDFTGVKVTMADFEMAFEEVIPQFGMAEEALQGHYRGGIISYGPPIVTLQTTMRRLIKQVRHSERTSLLSVLLCGDTGTGKSALSAMMAVQSQFPFVKRIGADSLIGMSEHGKSSAIIKAFEDSYRSPLSLIVLDDIERLMEYVDVGPRFSNHVLQTLLVKTKQPPALMKQQGVDADLGARMAQRKLLIIGTTSDPDVLDRLGLLSCFNLVLDIPQLEDPEHIRAVLAEEGDVPADALEAIVKGFAAHGGSVPIARLLMTLEMARQDTPTVTYDSFSACAFETGLWK